MSRYSYITSFSRFLSADHIQYRRLQGSSRRPNSLASIWSIRSSSQSRENRSNPKSSLRDHKVASNCALQLTVSRISTSQVDATVNPREHRVIESGVQYYSNSLSDGSGFKKKIHGGDGRDEERPDGGYNRGCAAFLEFHEVSRVRATGTNASLKLFNQPYPSFLYPDISPSGYDTLLASGEIYNNYLKIDVGYTPRLPELS